MSVDCESVRSRMSEFVEGGPAGESFQAHVSVCAPCAHALEAERRTRDLVRSAAPSLDPGWRPADARREPPKPARRAALLVAPAAVLLLFAAVLFAILRGGSGDFAPGRAGQEAGAGEVSRLIEKLRSQTIEERDEAFRRLKALGKAATAELQKAASSGDGELAARAKHLLRILEVRELLTPRLREAAPELEDRLAAGDNEACLEILRDFNSNDPEKSAKYKALRREDLEVLAAPAVRGAGNDPGKQEEACLLIWRHQLKSGVPEVAKLLNDEQFQKKIGAVMDVFCAGNLRELWMLEMVYMSRFGGPAKRMPKETGSDFWVALTKTQPPLLEPGAGNHLVCPRRFLGNPAGEPRATSYWGPASDVNALGNDEAVGLCDDPGHGDRPIVLFKNGSILGIDQKDLDERQIKKRLKAPDPKRP